MSLEPKPVAIAVCWACACQGELALLAVPAAPAAGAPELGTGSILILPLQDAGQVGTDLLWCSSAPGSQAWSQALLLCDLISSFNSCCLS